MSACATQVLGYPRIGKRRELKKATEAYWQGTSSLEELKQTASRLRQANWQLQKDSGINLIPSNDFSLYDQMLDMACLLGVIPERFAWDGTVCDTDTMFAMARGRGGADPVVALEMTKWFDTNYHYLVPELASRQTFRVASTKPFDEFREALAMGISTTPVLIGPLTFLLLSKSQFGRPVDNLRHLQELLPVYCGIIKYLHALGAEWLQIDEPILVTDLDPECLGALEMAYKQISAAAPELKIMLTTYFGAACSNLSCLSRLPIAGLHVDFTRNDDGLDDVLAYLPPHMMLSAGVVDGRNIWKNDLEKSLKLLRKLSETVTAERLIIAGSCSFIHVPISLAQEIRLEGALRNWLAFAEEKLGELQVLSKALAQPKSCQGELSANALAHEQRRNSKDIHRSQIKERCQAVKDTDLQRNAAYPVRAKAQKSKYRLPLFPTTTIGSMPQTEAVRAERAAFKKGAISQEQYDNFIKSEIERSVKLQEEIGLDVLVHGEFERNDMVEYFAQLLSGFAFTEHGWVQSFGSRYVKPPVISGDVARQQPMTIAWSKYAQSLTKRPMKGMLTGPVTILKWSFVRDDQSLAETCKQIALAIRDEVMDLEKAGVTVIQIDEPALREAMPLRESEQSAYFQWAVESFRLATSGVADTTQIHTHMCYCQFNDAIEAIAALDADVISIEASRSGMELLDCFLTFKYPNEVGPGIWDIHSPRVPPESEMVELLKKALAVLSAEQLWVNPDCGLKTRRSEEVTPALHNMVAAARKMRELKAPIAGR